MDVSLQVIYSFLLDSVGGYVISCLRRFHAFALVTSLTLKAFELQRVPLLISTDIADFNG